MSYTLKRIANAGSCINLVLQTDKVDVTMLTFGKTPSKVEHQNFY